VTGPAGRPGAAWAGGGDRGGELPGASSPARGVVVGVSRWRRPLCRLGRRGVVRALRWRRPVCRLGGRRARWRLRAVRDPGPVGCRLRVGWVARTVSCASRAPAPPSRAWAWHATRCRRRSLRSPPPEARRTRTAWSRGACRCGAAAACAAARRGRLRGVRRSTVHIMAQGAAPVCGTRILDPSLETRS